jgi:hypothetical protein
MNIFVVSKAFRMCMDCPEDFRPIRAFKTYEEAEEWIRSVRSENSGYNFRLDNVILEGFE